MVVNCSLNLINDSFTSNYSQNKTFRHIYSPRIKKCHLGIGYKSAIICNAFSIGYQWCSIIYYGLTNQIIKKSVTVPVSRNVSVALQPKKSIWSCGSN